MDDIKDDYLIEMAVTNLDLLILREQIRQCKNNLPPSRQLQQWICARNLLIEMST